MLYLSQRFDFEKDNALNDENGLIPTGTTAGSISLGHGSAPGGIGAGAGSPPPKKVPTDFGSVITSNQTNSAVFASKMDRFAINRHSIPESPPPGTYDTRPSWYTAKSVLPIAPPKTESILKALPVSPGPGEYDIAAETTHDRMKRRNRKNILVSTSERFQTDKDIQKKYVYDVGKKGSGPGPGDYDPNILVKGDCRSLVKPSYNALMNRDMFAQKS